jgi:hypothetical protein
MLYRMHVLDVLHALHYLSQPIYTLFLFPPDSSEIR